MKENYAKDRKEHYIKNKQIRDSNSYIGVPLYKKFPRLGTYVPALPKSTQIMFTANSGVGKTQTWIGLILLPTYKLIKEEGIKARFAISLLEDPINLFIDRLYAAVLFEITGKINDVLSINSIREQCVSQEVLDNLDIAEEIVNDILFYCDINDFALNPTGVYKWARNISMKYGTHVYVEKEFTSTNEDNKVVKESVKVYSHYEANDDTQIIMITDNLNNLSNETSEGKLLNQLQTINRFTRDYGRMQITKHWGWTMLNIMQQSAESEKQEYFKGESLIDKIEPSLDGLGNSRECQRDHLLIIGIFAPARYGVHAYFGYDIDKLGDNFRALKIIKSNISDSNIRIPFEFNGAISRFIELPLAINMTDLDYKAIKERNSVVR